MFDGCLAGDAVDHVIRHTEVERDHRGVECDAQRDHGDAARADIRRAEREYSDVGDQEQRNAEVLEASPGQVEDGERDLDGEADREQPDSGELHLGQTREGAVGDLDDGHGDGNRNHVSEHVQHRTQALRSHRGSPSSDWCPTRTYSGSDAKRSVGAHVGSGAMSESEVLYEVDGAIARVTINRPERRNSMSYGVMQGLRDAVAAAKADDAVRVLVLTGTGDKAFCAGADLGGIAENAGAAAAHEGRGLLADLFREMWDLGKPTIARVRGFALAGGFGLALACDVVIAADDAQFGTPEVNVGLWPYMITVPMLRSMPAKTVLELQMTGRRVGAEEALRLGFVSRVVPVEALDTAVDEFASALASKSPLVLRWGRDAFYRVLEMDADAALDYLQGMLTIHTQSEDAAEGVAAFAEKRTPLWKGR
jgi:Enoyl-CoA hydratase/carnithine racemase